MKLIPPTHGRAACRVVIPREEYEHHRDETLNRLREKLDAIYREALGVDAPVPESWLMWQVEEPAASDVIDLRVEVRAPTRSTRVFLSEIGEVRELQIPVTTDSRIPVVKSPHRFEDPFDRPDWYYVFQGWDAETGLMVFARS